MIFTIEVTPFLRQVESVVGSLSKEETTGPVLRLIACQGRVYIKAAGRASELAAIVWEDGQCTVSLGVFLSLLKTYRYENVTIEADGQNLRVRGASMPVESYCSWALAPEVGAALAATD